MYTNDAEVSNRWINIKGVRIKKEKYHEKLPYIGREHKLLKISGLSYYSLSLHCGGGGRAEASRFHSVMHIADRTIHTQEITNPFEFPICNAVITYTLLYKKEKIRRPINSCMD